MHAVGSSVLTVGVKYVNRQSAYTLRLQMKNVALLKNGAYAIVIYLGVTLYSVV